MQSNGSVFLQTAEPEWFDEEPTWLAGCLSEKELQTEDCSESKYLLFHIQFTWKVEIMKRPLTSQVINLIVLTKKSILRTNANWSLSQACEGFAISGPALNLA